MTIADHNLIYLYCVTDQNPLLEGLGEEVSVVCVQGLFAVVQHVSAAEFSRENLLKNLADLEWVKARACLHEKICEEVMRNNNLLPFKLATIFNSEDNLKAMLAAQGEELRSNLRYLAGREEWGVKAYCDISRLKADLLAHNEELLRIAKEKNTVSAGRAFFLEKKKEELLNNLVSRRVNEVGQQGFQGLANESVDSRINKLLPKEVTEKEEVMILNAAFLVERERVSAFTEIVSGLKAGHAGQGFLFDCSGPWPPYNFCKMA